MILLKSWRTRLLKVLGFRLQRTTPRSKLMRGPDGFRHRVSLATGEIVHAGARKSVEKAIRRQAREERLRAGLPE